MGVGDGAAVRNCDRGAFVVVGHGIFFYRVRDFLPVPVKTRDPGPLHRVGVAHSILVGGRYFGNREFAGVIRRDVGRAGEERQIILILLRRRPLAVLVVVVLPHLGDLDIGKIIGVLISYGVVGIRVHDGAGCGLTFFEGLIGIGVRKRASFHDNHAIFIQDDIAVLVQLGFSCLGFERGARKHVAFWRRFHDGIGRTGGEVEEAQTVARQQVELYGGFALGVIVSGPRPVTHLLVDRARITDLCGNNSVLQAAVVYGEPYPVIGVEVVGCAGCSPGVLNGDREREDLLGIGILAVNDLHDVQVGAALVGCRQGGGIFAVVDIVCGAVDGIGFCSAGRGMLGVHLDEHGHLAVDHHRVHGGDVQLPVIGDVLRLLKGEVVALGAADDLASLVDDADGDVDAPGPVIIIGKRDGILLFSVAQDVERDRFGSILVERIHPLFGQSKLLHSLGFDAVDAIEIRSRGLGLLQTGIRIGQLGSGVGGEGAGLLVDVLLHFFGQLAPGARVSCIHIRIVLHVRQDIQGGLAGIHLEGHGIGHAGQQGADGIQIPFHRTADQLRIGRRLGIEIIGALPLVSQISGGGDAAFHGDGFGIIPRAPGNLVFALGFLILGHGVGDRLGVGVHAGELHAAVQRDGEPVLVRILVDLQQVHHLPAFHGDVAGGAVVNGDGGNAHEIGNVLEDLGNGFLQLIGAARIEVALGSYGTAGHAAVGFGTVRVVVGEIDQVVQEVGLIAESVNGIQRRILLRGAVGLELLDGIGLIRSTLIARPARGIVVREASAAHILGGGAVGHENDEGTVLVRCPQKSGVVLVLAGELLQRGFPVGAAGVSQLAAAIGPVRRKLARDSALRFGPALYHRGAGVEGDQGHLDVRAFRRVAKQTMSEIVHDLFRSVRSGDRGITISRVVQDH